MGVAYFLDSLSGPTFQNLRCMACECRSCLTYVLIVAIVRKYLSRFERARLRKNITCNLTWCYTKPSISSLWCHAVASLSRFNDRHLHRRLKIALVNGDVCRAKNNNYIFGSRIVEEIYSASPNRKLSRPWMIVPSIAKHKRYTVVESGVISNDDK